MIFMHIQLIVETYWLILKLLEPLYLNLWDQVGLNRGRLFTDQSAILFSGVCTICLGLPTLQVNSMEFN